MSAQDDYVGRCRGLVLSLWGILTSDECAEVEHLIEHDECPEAMRTLAWIIVDGDKRVPADAIAAIRELAGGMVAGKHMPPELDEYVSRHG